ncbi:MAG: alanine--tRNA ligase, partial [Firmicutes bacterium]|nr:alanine--tRNA ligase [Bacillota bacterium]
LCGGTHLTNTAQAGSFKILSESGVASGVRRIEAVTGRKALEFYNNQELELKKIAAIVKSAKDRVVESVENLQQQNKALQKELESLKSQMTANAANDILKDVYSVGDIKVLCVYQPDLGMDELKNMGDTLKDKLGACVLVLAGGKEKVQFVAMATQEAVAAGAHAGNIVREAAKICGGGGGGKPAMAQAGGKDASKAEEALKAAKAVIEAQLS